MSSVLATKGPSSERTHRRTPTIRVLIVDDSITARTAMARAVEASGEVAVIGTASSAEVALQLLQLSRVDVILLDLEMPGMGGLKALPRLIEASHGAEILVVSSLATAGAEPTLAALAMGAADTLAKPRSGDFDDGYRRELLEKLRALAHVREGAIAARIIQPKARSVPVKPGVIAIGASTGGIHALGRFFSTLPSSCNVPILLTQHLPTSFMPVFARQVSAMAGRPAAIAEPGSIVRPGTVWIAPGDAHLVVHRRGDELVCDLRRFSAASGCCPSVDPMLQSVAETLGSAGIAVILSGMGRDGSTGARLLNEAGGAILAQNEETCAVFGMPRGVVEAGIASAIESPEDLGRRIAKLAGLGV